MACENAVLSANQNDVEPCLIGQAAYEAATPTPATDESTSSGLFSTVASRRHQAIKGKGLNDDFREIIGARGALREVLALVRTVAPTNSTTLIEGETGTGKELVARAIHEHSTRIDRPFVKVNCAAIPLGLLESELFGHERGAFTGAVTRKVGRFEAANQGTLFLDEVGDIPPELQPKLLRVLQDGEFERLGSTQTQRANVRLDIPLLVTHFVGIYSERMNKQIAWIPREAMEALIRHSWPGNVRELQNFIERSVILTSGNVLRPPLDSLKPAAETESLRAITLEDAEREHICKTLEQTRWVIAGHKGAAERLGIKRSTLYFRMQRLGISRSDREPIPA